MKFPKLQFPHISRLFSASMLTAIFFWTSRITLWSLLIALFYANITAKLNTSNTLPTPVLSALRTPFLPQVHTNLATALWKNGLITEAKHEISLAEDLTQTENSAVLGANISPSGLIKEWEAQPQKKEALYSFWKTVIRTRPDYRDAYIQAGSFAYELGDTEEAMILLQKAHELDPSSQTTSLILSTLSGNK